VCFSHKTFAGKSLKLAGKCYAGPAKKTNDLKIVVKISVFRTVSSSFLSPHTPLNEQKTRHGTLDANFDNVKELDRMDGKKLNATGLTELKEER
jgi:hypothetical protein